MAALRNPLTRDETIGFVATIASTGAFALGYHRLAGGILATNGVYNLARGHKLPGGAGLAIGSSFLFFPSWPDALRGAIQGRTAVKELPPPVQLNMPPFERVSYPSFDRMLDGDWRMLDVRDIRGSNVAAKAVSLKPGNVASLVLQNKSGPFMVYNARVIGGGGGQLYAAQWASQPPVGGPQMIDFSQEHVFATHQ